ncbi:MAG: HAD family hydrolase [Vulcanimicrobiaceae bacterium]
MDPYPVLLDIDGTLLDSNDAHAQSWADAFRAYGYAISAQRVRPLIGMGGDKLLKTLVPGLHPEDGSVGQKLSERRQKIFLAEYAAALRPTRGARDLLLELRRRKCRLVVASSAKAEELDTLLQAARVADLIDRAATSDDAQASKPEPDIIEAAMRKGGVRANHTFLIGDTPYDLLAASAARVPMIAVRCGGWDAPELAEAAGIYNDPADILAHLDSPPLNRLVPSAPKTSAAQH